MFLPLIHDRNVVRGAARREYRRDFKKSNIADIFLRNYGDGAEMTNRKLTERVMIARDL